MPDRITEKRIRQRLEFVEELIGVPMAIGCAYGAYRVENESGSRDISGRGNAREINWFLDGFLAALSELRRKQMEEDANASK